MTKWISREIQKNVLAQIGKRLLAMGAVVGFMAAFMADVPSAAAQVAGSSTLGVTTEEMKIVTVGWSAKKKVLGKAVYNDNKQKIGVVDDLIIAPDRSVSYAIIGVGGFVGRRKARCGNPSESVEARPRQNHLARRDQRRIKSDAQVCIR
jgi:hypothetical protein